MDNLLKYKGYYGTVEYCSNNQMLTGKVIGVNRLISYKGESVDALIHDFEAAVDDYLDLCEEKGLEPDKTYKGCFNVRVCPDLHKDLVLYSAAKGKNLNTVVEEAIREYVKL